MLTIFNLQWLRLKREPALVLIFLAMTVAFVFFMLGTGGKQTLTIQTFSDNLSEIEMEQWVERLNETDAYKFQVQNRETIEKQIKMNQIAFALELDQAGYRFLVGSDSQSLIAVDQHVGKIYRTHLQIDAVRSQFPNHQVILRDFIEIDSQSLAGSISNREEGSFNVMVGMTLYFSTFTILFGLMNIASEKRTGTWDRLISTPLKKSEIYLGQLLHHFMIGVLQIGICFYIFHQFFNYNLGSQYLTVGISIMAYVFATVALGMLIISIVRSPQQLQAVIPIVATGTAMLGGAFWPLEIVSNRLLLMASKITPIHFGMAALKGPILYNRGILEILEPISILLLMGILFMGVGLNLMERKN